MGDVEMTGPGQLKNFKKLLFICLQSYKDGNEEVCMLSNSFSISQDQGMIFSAQLSRVHELIPVINQRALRVLKEMLNNFENVQIQYFKIN